MCTKSSADEATYFTIAVVKMDDELLNDMWVTVNRDEDEKVVSVGMESGVENAISFFNEAHAKSFCNTVRKLYPDMIFEVMSVSINF